tara:strand:+ start:806 stop:1468 length:663 start_codon:yes stop_codon:yes gene_type:complete
MGGWELIIALFGGAWYVISAISAANEKKKKKANRKLALQAEELASKPNPLAAPQQSSASLEKTSDPAKRVKETLPVRESKLDVSLARSQGKPALNPRVARQQQPGVMREARKAILDSMRKELGLPSQAKNTPPAGPASLKVPPVTPPMPAIPAAAKASQPAKPPRRRPRPAPALSASGRQEQASAKVLASILKEPAGLKQAMVLSEIFQPPVTLRSQHLS